MNHKPMVIIIDDPDAYKALAACTASMHRFAEAIHIVANAYRPEMSRFAEMAAKLFNDYVEPRSVVRHRRGRHEYPKMQRPEVHRLAKSKYARRYRHRRHRG